MKGITKELAFVIMTMCSVVPGGVGRERDVLPPEELKILNHLKVGISS